MAPRRGDPRRITRRVIIMHETKVELGLGMQAQIVERRE